mmetsp:Transcript_41948/g.111736  ORF Transcript_41948/g.111736 Transcript_41948/m.111736 type:complete len:180 (+) Transcript_41948:952-1491(+)
MAVERALVLWPIKTFAFFWHYACWGFVYHAKFDMIQTTMPVTASDSSYQEYNVWFNTFVVAAFLCFGIEWVSFTQGASLLRPRIAMISSLLHGMGAVFLLWMVADAWAWFCMIYIFFIFTLPPALLESWALIAVWEERCRGCGRGVSRALGCGKPCAPWEVGCCGKGCRASCRDGVQFV